MATANTWADCIFPTQTVLLVTAIFSVSSLLLFLTIHLHKTWYPSRSLRDSRITEEAQAKKAAVLNAISELRRTIEDLESAMAGGRKIQSWATSMTVKAHTTLEEGLDKFERALMSPEVMEMSFSKENIYSHFCCSTILKTGIFFWFHVALDLEFEKSVRYAIVVLRSVVMVLVGSTVVVVEVHIRRRTSSVGTKASQLDGEVVDGFVLVHSRKG